MRNSNYPPGFTGDPGPRLSPEEEEADIRLQNAADDWQNERTEAYFAALSPADYPPAEFPQTDAGFAEYGRWLAAHTELRAANAELRRKLDTLLTTAGEAFRLIEEGWRGGWVPKVSGMAARDALRKAMAEATGD